MLDHDRAQPSSASAVPWTIGTSREKIAWTSACPIPGQPKIASTTTTPSTSVTNRGAEIGQQRHRDIAQPALGAAAFGARAQPLPLRKGVEGHRSDPPSRPGAIRALTAAGGKAQAQAQARRAGGAAPCPAAGSQRSCTARRLDEDQRHQELRGRHFTPVEDVTNSARSSVPPGPSPSEGAPSGGPISSDSRTATVASDSEAPS